MRRAERSPFAKLWTRLFGYLVLNHLALGLDLKFGEPFNPASVEGHQLKKR
jgi:hypothetical protein